MIKYKIWINTTILKFGDHKRYWNSNTAKKPKSSEIFRSGIIRLNQLFLGRNKIFLIYWKNFPSINLSSTKFNCNLNLIVVYLIMSLYYCVHILYNKLTLKKFTDKSQNKLHNSAMWSILSIFIFVISANFLCVEKKMLSSTSYANVVNSLNFLNFIFFVKNQYEDR